MDKKSSIYTRTGDSGSTSLIGGVRVRKNHCRVNAYGTVDELNSFIGLLISQITSDDNNRQFLSWIQNCLFDLGAYLATDSNNLISEPPFLRQTTISKLENEINIIDAALSPLDAFILPGGCTAAALANVCRAICRRCEREIVTLNENHLIDVNVIRFVNRLSDYLFVLGRQYNYNNHVSEKKWNRDI